jgi:hypothetical protein
MQARTKAHIVRFVKEGSHLNMDEASNFKLLKVRCGYDHEMVDHSEGNTFAVTYTPTQSSRSGLR